MAALAICPLDVLKTRKQFDSKPNSASVSTVALLKEIAAENGFRGFYAGLASSIAGNLSSFAIYFFTYEKIKKIQHRIIQTHGTFRHTLESIAAAVIAGGISTTVTTPFWVVRAKCMVKCIFTSFTLMNVFLDGSFPSKSACIIADCEAVSPRRGFSLLSRACSIVFRIIACGRSISSIRIFKNA